MNYDCFYDAFKKILAECYELSTEQIKPVVKVDHRLDAITRQIERLQDIFTEIAEVLPREFD